MSPFWRPRSLSAGLLVLTIFFVMLAEVLIYAPSMARFRIVYLQERLAAAHLAALSLDATPSRSVSEDLEGRLLRHVQAHSVELRLGPLYTHMLGGRAPPPVDARVDLRDPGFVDLIRDAFMTLAQTRNRILHVTGTSPSDPAVLVEMVLDEAPLRMAMVDFSTRILQLSIIISLITAGLVYLSLRWLIVRPIGRLTEAMTRFRQDPENQLETLAPEARPDEIGVAQRELAAMQADLRAALRQKTHLAALGEAMTKIHHDLRNILATAQLVSDRLADSADPQVRRVTPTLLDAIDRAIALCGKVLAFARADPPGLALAPCPLRELVADAGKLVLPDSAMEGGELDGAPMPVAWRAAVPNGLAVLADRDELLRVLVNLGRNAAEAGATEIRIAAEQRDGRVALKVHDNGPGLPPRAREHLFQPFAGSAKAGGSGLGLAIAREVMRAHGGGIRLVSSDAAGTEFELDLRPGAPG